MSIRIAILLFLALGSVSGRSDGTILRVYQTTDDVLWGKSEGAALYKNLFLLGGDLAWAAYFAGREAVYREMLLEINTSTNPTLILRPE